MNEEKHSEMLNTIADFVITTLKSDEEKSPEMVSAIAELVGKAPYF
jgi:hypothetical protein